MIQTEIIKETLIRTYSDQGMKIERDGIRYDEAIDPIDMNRVYTETEEPIDSDIPFGELTDTQALNIIIGSETL